MSESERLGRRSKSAWGVALARLVRDPMAIVSLAVLLLLVLACTVGAGLWRYPYDEITPDLSQAPSITHPLGTDTLGHDVLALILRGLGQSLTIAALVAVAATVLGVFGGIIAGYCGGVADNVIMRLVDLILTIPSMALAAFLGSRLRGVGVSTWALALVLAALLWTSIARIVRGVTISIKQELYVDAATLMGESGISIMIRHILPNVLDQVIVAVTLLVSTAILTESGLSFLGFGVRPPDTSLGLLVSNAKDLANTLPWTFYFPGLAIILVVLAVNFFGEALRRSFNPRKVFSDYLNPRVTMRGMASVADGKRKPARPSGAVAGTHPVVTSASTRADELTHADEGADVVLDVCDLSVRFPGADRAAVDHATFTVNAGEVIGLVGESGSGKSMTTSAIMGLLPGGAQVSGAIRFRGEDLMDYDYRHWQKVRGSKISVILQDPMTSLNPVLTIFTHFKETFEALGMEMGRQAMRGRATELMESVGIVNPASRLDQYPHELSGGMRQRVVIALSVVGSPDLIIADEPTTALDVTVQAKVMRSLELARRNVNASMIFITHDLALVAGVADRIVVMKDGRMIEQGPTDEIFAHPRDPYTRNLLNRIPRLETSVAVRAETAEGGAL